APPLFVEPIRIGATDFIERVCERIHEAAAHPEPHVFCPPLCAFTEPSGAATENLAEGVALSVECDSSPYAALKKPTGILGKPTAIVASGGAWKNPQNGRLEHKLHLHWRLCAHSRPDSSRRAFHNYPLTDRLQFDILRSGPGWRGPDAIRSIETARVHHAGRWRGVAVNDIASCLGASLSDATGTCDRSVRARWSHGYIRPPDRTKFVRASRETVLRREHRRCWRQRRYGSGGKGSTGRLHHTRCSAQYRRQPRPVQQRPL